ncbi:MAG TPA: GtrA family protein [Solirubrobacteraceae bacterium]|nr:GtrA family protein [Solirubrobacteraceae bacterium]
MSDSTHSTMEFELPLGARMRHGVRRTHGRLMVGVRHPANWLQLIRFGAVGASGYIVNLAVFAACVHLVKIDYRLASVAAFLVSVGNNFWLNRHWTFSAKEHHPGRQAVKFFAVSLVAYGFSYVVLTSLVDGAGVDKVIAQAIAVVAAMPLSFIGQKLWSFRA